jgi:MFS family permease
MNLTLHFTPQRYFRLGVSLFFFLQGLTFSSWAGRIPDFKRLLSLSDGALGAVLLALPMGQMTAMGLSGYLVSKFGSRKTLGIGAILYPGMLVALGTVQEVWQLAGGLFLFGMFANLCNISVNTQGVGVEKIYRRSIMASFHGLWSLAGFTGGLISSWMVAHRIAPLPHYIIIYALTLLLLLIGRKYILPRDPQNAVKNGPQEKNKIFVKPNKSILLLGLVAFSSMICEGTMFEWSGIYFEKVVEAPEELTRMGFVAFMTTMAAGRFTADFAATKFGVTRVLQGSGILIFIGMMTSVIWPALPTATIGFLLVGLGTSSVVPMAYSLAGKTTEMPSGMALASVSTIGFFGFLIGPPLIGFISEWSNLKVSFAAIALAGLCTAFLAIKLKK